MSSEIIVHATNFVQRPVCQRPVETLTSSRKTIQSHRSSMIYREFNQDLPWKRDTLVAHPRARKSPAKFNFLPAHLQFYDVHFIDHLELPRLLYPLLPSQSPRLLCDDTSRPVGHIVFRRIPWSDVHRRSCTER